MPLLLHIPNFIFLLWIFQERFILFIYPLECQTPIYARTMRNRIFLIKSSATSYYSACFEELTYRNSCKWILLQEGHERQVCIIHRMKCRRCGTFHRELPDFLVPYKHYTAVDCQVNCLTFLFKSDPSDDLLQRIYFNYKSTRCT